MNYLFFAPIVLSLLVKALGMGAQPREDPLLLDLLAGAFAFVAVYWIVIRAWVSRRRHRPLCRLSSKTGVDTFLVHVDRAFSDNARALNPSFLSALNRSLAHSPQSPYAAFPGGPKYLFLSPEPDALRFYAGLEYQFEVFVIDRRSIASAEGRPIRLDGGRQRGVEICFRTGGDTRSFVMVGIGPLMLPSRRLSGRIARLCRDSAGGPIVPAANRRFAAARSPASLTDDGAEQPPPSSRPADAPSR